MRHSALTGIAVDPAIVPSMVDEFPVLFVAAAMVFVVIGAGLSLMWFNRVL